MTEAEYWRDYEIIKNEVNCAIKCFYTYIEIHKFASEDKDIYNTINRSVSFWNINLYSLQSTFFIVLARIFDEDATVHSVHKLLTATVKHPEYFSKSALGARKEKIAGQTKPDWLDDYLNEAWEPTASDLASIKKMLKPHTKKFTAIYRPIRHEIFAHKILKDDQSISNLMGKAVILEIDDVLCFLFHLMETIWQIFCNGTQPEPNSHAAYIRRKDEIKANTRDVLRTLAAGYAAGLSEKS